VDIALRYGSPNDTNLYGFKICDVPGLLCATPEYLKKHGTPQQPEDLYTHNGLFYQMHDIVYDVWQFSKGGKDFKIKMGSNRIANDAELVRRWCVAGHGLAVKSCLDLAEDLLSGRLVSVMSDYKPRSTELWLVCPSRQSITPAMRLLRDAFREKCSNILKQLNQRGLIS
jgi:DNA-binding transcriptional LysR family regulator